MFMQSDGGLVPSDQFDGAHAVLSGPAGGVVGYSTTAYTEYHQAVIGFDMGGTSTDVNKIDSSFSSFLLLVLRFLFAFVWVNPFFLPLPLFSLSILFCPFPHLFLFQLHLFHFGSI